MRATTALTLALSASFAAASPPNIVFFLADDLGSADVGYRGGEIKTPAIDKLAKAGAQLDAFYVQPVCSPTRAALMTGRYPMRHGLQVGVVRPWAQYGLPLDERTLPQALKEAGYTTAIVGKWHLGHFAPEYLPTRRGFDHQYGHYNGALDYYTHIRDGGFDWHKDDKACRDEGYTTHLLAKEACRIIADHDAKKPLFLYVPFNAVHAPHQVPDKYREPYSAMKEPRRTYAGMLAAMDEAIGQIVDAVEKKGLRKETLFVFSSDNGGPQSGEHHQQRFIARRQGDGVRRRRARQRVRHLGRPHQTGQDQRALAHGRLVSDVAQARRREERTEAAASMDSMLGRRSRARNRRRTRRF